MNSSTKSKIYSIFLLSILILDVGFIGGFNYASASNCTATGGTITTVGSYEVHTFTSSGTFTVTAGSCNALVLVVAGGGGGSSGGGGAGGFQYNASYPLTVQAYTVTIGAGGAAGISDGTSRGSNGGNSIFGQITSTGGGGAGTLFNGGGAGSGGKNGGSGGGGGADTTGASTGGTGTVGQGNNGGTNGGFNAATFPSGGGGGASVAGHNGVSNSESGAGGNGTVNSISGSSIIYSCGGGGGQYNAGTSGLAGCTTGGDGKSNGVTGSSASANKGGGGGGAGAGASGGAGGSGVVVVAIFVPGPPTAPTLTKSNTLSTTSIQSFWTSSIGATWYVLKSASPNGGAFSTVVNQTGTNYTNTGLTPGTQYQYEVFAGNTTGSSSASNTKSNYTSQVAPTALTFSQVTSVSARLSWTNPSGNATVNGFKIERESPIGGGFTTFVTTTNSTNHYDFTGLTSGTQYNVRISTIYGDKPYTSSPSTTAAFYTLTTVTVGAVNMTATNTVTTPIFFTRTDPSSTTTVLTVQYPNTMNLTCGLSYLFALKNNTYSNLSQTNVGGGQVTSGFTFTNGTNDIITATCTDKTTGQNAKYILTQTTNPLLKQANNFRAGKYGTAGNFGGLDIITLIGVTLAMIGFNRVNEAAGAVVCFFVIGALGYYQIITFPTVMIGALAIVILLAVVSTKKQANYG